MSSIPLLSAVGISKSFPGVRALASVDFMLNSGEVHCLIGENGAGKSTLVKILAGVQQPDEGKIRIDGTNVSLTSPHAAQHAGVACIFQELNVVGGLSIAENIVLGNEPRKRGFFDKRKANAEARKLLDEIGFSDLDQTQLCARLSTAHKQAVMVAKALRQNARIIIMDEPTSPLEGAEVKKLFDVIGRLKAAGKGIIYVSHKMREIEYLGDRVTVFKDGERVTTVARGEASTHDLVRSMVGRNIEDMFPEKRHSVGDVAFEARHLESPFLHDVSLSVRSGEVLGIAGLVGSGRTELLRTLFGADPLTSGEIIVGTMKLARNSTSAAIKAGLALVPEERRAQGIVPVLSVFENAALVWDEFPNLRSSSKPKGVAIRAAIEKLSVKTPSLSQRIDKLSGGNQQKVVLSKWLLARTKIMLLDEPTRGIDVGAKREIYRIVSELAEAGMAVVLVSSELPELLGLADRIIVMNAGSIVGELPGDTTEEEIVSLSMMHADSISAPAKGD